MDDEQCHFPSTVTSYRIPTSNWRGLTNKGTDSEPLVSKGVYSFRIDVSIDASHCFLPNVLAAVKERVPKSVNDEVQSSA